MPTIAIVIATYNGADTLEATLDSLAAQTVKPDQIVIMDGGSSDGTQDILKRREAMLTYWESQPDGGVYDAWNKALPHVTADWVSFVGCDDILAGPEVIEQWKQWLATLPAEAGITYGRVAMMGRSGAINEYYGEPWDMVGRKMRHRMVIPFTGTMIRRALFGTVGPFDTQYRIAGDYDWASRAIQHTEVRFLDRVVAMMGDGGLSGATATQVRTVLEDGRIIEARGRRKPLAWHWRLLKVRAKDMLNRTAGPELLRRAVDLYRICTFRKPRLSSR